MNAIAVCGCGMLSAGGSRSASTLSAAHSGTKKPASFKEPADIAAGAERAPAMPANQIAKSSIETPRFFSFSTSQFGLRPRPDQVSSGFSGLRNFGATGAFEPPRVFQAKDLVEAHPASAASAAIFDLISARSVCWRSTIATLQLVLQVDQLFETELVQSVLRGACQVRHPLICGLEFDLARITRGIVPQQ